MQTAHCAFEKRFVNPDLFGGNQCTNEKCEPIENPKKKSFVDAAVFATGLVVFSA